MNADRWSALSHPPATALRQIQAGRLKGKTDINPMWRYEAMTEQYGPCGVGWRYGIDRLWTEPGADGQVCAFALVSLFVSEDGEWSAAIPGIGGSMLIVQESNGVHTSDEAYKMAVTDALSVAMKMLGVGAAIYAGAWDGSKYRDTPATAPERPQDAPAGSAAVRHPEPPQDGKGEGSSVNAGPLPKDKADCVLTGKIRGSITPDVKHGKAGDHEVAYFDLLLDDGTVYLCTAWHEAREAAMALHMGDFVDVVGRWNVWNGKVRVDVSVVTLQSSAPVEAYDTDEIPF